MKDRPTVYPVFHDTLDSVYLVKLFWERGDAESYAAKENSELEEWDPGSYFVPATGREVE